MRVVLRSLVALAVAFVMIRPAPAQNPDEKSRAFSTIDATPPGTVNPKPLPPLANPNAPNLSATELFVRKTRPVPGAARPIGAYSNGCLAGAQSLPITGPTWQVMRLSRNRNWGTPRLVQFLERLGDNAKKGGWNGLLIGDMAQPRGGPMSSGHASHQIGLDVDIWFTPMPGHVLSREERETDSAVNVVAPDGLDVDKVWTHAHMEVVKAAAEDPDVTRIFVNAAIKKKLCSEAGTDRAWLAKVRPWWGHAEHFHVRLACPPEARECKPQLPVPPGDGCGHALDFWFKPSILHPPPPKGPPPRRLLTLAKMPPACREVVKAP
jgi:penicillin-insensitive murein endopeptidase